MILPRRSLIEIISWGTDDTISCNKVSSIPFQQKRSAYSKTLFVLCFFEFWYKSCIYISHTFSMSPKNSFLGSKVWAGALCCFQIPRADKEALKQEIRCVQYRAVKKKINISSDKRQLLAHIVVKTCLYDHPAAIVHHAQCQQSGRRLSLQSNERPSRLSNVKRLSPLNATLHRNLPFSTSSCVLILNGPIW